MIDNIVRAISTIIIVFTNIKLKIVVVIDTIIIVNIIKVIITFIIVITR